MIRRTMLVLLAAAAILVLFSVSDAHAQQAFGQQWGQSYRTQDWNRFYHYPYVYYPQNFWSADYYRSSDNLYYRYPPEMQIRSTTSTGRTTIPSRGATTRDRTSSSTCSERL